MMTFFFSLKKMMVDILTLPEGNNLNMYVEMWKE